jgi:hypothetical protein
VKKTVWVINGGFYHEGTYVLDVFDYAPTQKELDDLRTDKYGRHQYDLVNAMPFEVKSRV